LNTFTRSILCAAKENFYDELKSRKIICILLDNCKDIFKVPQDLVEEVEYKIVEKAKQVISYIQKDLKNYFII
jgi:hypothetical protein